MIISAEEKWHSGRAMAAIFRLMSATGTNAKCQPHRGMSEFEGKAENICSYRVFRILTRSGLYDQRRLCEATY
jgi:hypothetical protein